jgi:hypothetical protein
MQHGRESHWQDNYLIALKRHDLLSDRIYHHLQFKL